MYIGFQYKTSYLKYVFIKTRVDFRFIQNAKFLNGQPLHTQLSVYNLESIREVR